MRYENNRLPIGSLKLLPQDYAADVYHKVRLEAGALHLANYLIRSAVYILSAKVDKISIPFATFESCQMELMDLI